MFQAYVSPAGTFKTKAFLNKPLIKKKKKNMEEKKEKEPSICKILWNVYEITLKPGQGVIVSLHECVEEEVIGPDFHFQEAFSGVHANRCAHSYIQGFARVRCFYFRGPKVNVSAFLFPRLISVNIMEWLRCRDKMAEGR